MEYSEQVLLYYMLNNLFVFFGVSSKVDIFFIRKFLLIQLFIYRTLVKGDPKVTFTIATTPKCWGGHDSIP